MIIYKAAIKKGLICSDFRQWFGEKLMSNLTIVNYTLQTEGEQ